MPRRVVVRPSGALRRWTRRVESALHIQMIESLSALFDRHGRARFGLAAAVLLALGCTSRRVATSDFPAVTFATMPSPTERRGPSSADAVEAVLAAARDTLGVSSPRLDGDAVPTDCSGYLHALYKRADVDLFSEGRPGDNGVRAIVRWVERYGRLYRAQLYFDAMKSVMKDARVYITSDGIPTTRFDVDLKDAYLGTDVFKPKDQ